MAQRVSRLRSFRVLGDSGRDCLMVSWTGWARTAVFSVRRVW